MTRRRFTFWKLLSKGREQLTPGTVSDGDDRRGQKLKTQKASKCLILKNFPGLGSQIVEMTRKCNAPCKRTQYCWPTTPNIVGCYMLRPFAHPVACCWMLLRKV